MEILNSGCLIQLLTTALFLFFMFTGVDVGPVLGTILWGAFFFGFILYPKSEENKDEIKRQNLNFPKRNNETLNVQHFDTKVPVEPVSISSTPQKKYPIIKTNYLSTNDFRDLDVNTYPIVLLPKQNAYIKFPKEGKRCNVGAAEELFFNRLKHCFNEEIFISKSKHVKNKNGGFPFEPDIVLIRNKNKKNIFIEIEIDEPYDGITRIPTHLIGQDDWRNQFFTNRGWIVVRFTERQIVFEPNHCMFLIAEIIQSIDSSFTIPINLMNFERPTSEPCWNNLDSARMEQSKYRESYLNKTFVQKNRAINLSTDYLNSEDEQNIENMNPDNDTLIFPFHSNKEKLTIKNNSERLVFIPETHKYLIDGNGHTLSVSETIELFFKPFDPLKAILNMKNGRNWNEKNVYWNMPDDEIELAWEENKTLQAAHGTQLHHEIDFYFKYNLQPNISPEFNQFLNFISDFNSLKLVQSEYKVFDETHLIGGTIDALFMDLNGRYYIYDWKRSKKLVDERLSPKSWGIETGLGGLGHIENTSLNKYSLQQNLYKYILEKNYNIKIDSMNLVVFHPILDNYQLIQVRNLQKEIKTILNNLEDFRLR